jgi:phage tail-like protein
MPEAAQDSPEAQQGFVDPYGAYNFRLEIQGIESARFTHCSGLGAKIHSIPYREGGISQVVHHLAGPVRYGDVQLRYGLTSSTELWDWFMEAVAGNVNRKNVSIVLLQSDGVQEAGRWNLENAWPCEWRGAVLDALGQEVAIESLTLVFESLQRG